MNRSLLTLLCIISLASAKAQIKGLTETGREIILFDNGTWKYATDSVATTTDIDSLTTGKIPMKKPNDATFLAKSTTFNVGIYINPAKWTFESHEANETNPEYKFSFKKGQGYAMMVTEKTPVDLVNMRQIALSNARRASLDVKETTAEYRIVNGKKVLCMIFQATVQGIKFVYYAYYYSNSNGTIQLLAYSSQQYFDATRQDLENFLNGLIEIQK